MSQRLLDAILPSRGGRDDAFEALLSRILPPREYQRKLSPYEKRVDFEAARKVFDEDAWGADLKIREQVKKARDSLLKTVKERAESNALTPQWVGTMTVDTPPKVVDILADYLMDVWRKGRDLALKELPENVSKGLADVKRFSHFALFHLPGQHDQCDHSVTGECVDPEWEKSPENPKNKPVIQAELTGKNGRLVYKAVPKEVVDSIVRFGIKKDGEWRGRPPSVYFTESKAEALRYGVLLVPSYKFAVVEFRMSKTDFAVAKPDEYDREQASFPNSWRTENNIAPGKIKAVEIYEFDKTLNKPVLRSSKKIGKHEQDEHTFYTIIVIEPTNGNAKTLVHSYAGLEPTKAVEYLRNTRPWLIKGVIDDELKKQARFQLAEHLKGGRALNETLGNLRDIFEPWIGDPTKITPTGMTGIGFPPGEFAPENILMAYRLENIIRTESVTAFAQGRVAVGDEAEDYVIGYELSAILDQRTCFRDFTLINSSRGAIPISAIRPGDMVLSGANCWRRVKACWRHVATNWRKLTFSDGRFIICTHTHPFWVRNQIGFEWIEAHEITAGDTVATSMDPASSSVDYGAGSGKGFKPATLRSLWPHISPVQQQSAEILLERLPHIMGENQLAETKTMRTMRQSPAEKMWYEEKVLFKEMLPDSELGIRCLPWLSERVQAQENGFGQRSGILLQSGMLSEQEAQPDPENMPDMSQIICRIQMPNGQSELLFPEMLAYGQRSESDRENSGQCFEKHGNSIRTAGQNWKANGRFSYSAVAHPRDGRRILASGQTQGCEENTRIDESRFSCVEIPLRDNFPSTCRAIKTSTDHAPEPIASGTINVLSNEPVTEIEWAYDLEVEGDHSYIANGLISHNTEICKAADGVKFPKDHRLAVKLTPSLHYQCRTIPVFIVTDDLPVEWSTEAELDSVVRLIPEGFK